MFIDDFVPVARDLVVTNAWLLSEGVEIARAAADATLATEAVALGPPRTRSDELVLPLVWTTAPRAPFVALHGDLQTAGLDIGVTYLSLSASCDLAVDPPGRRGQEFAARRAAEQSVRTFLQRFGAELEHRSVTGPEAGD